MHSKACCTALRIMLALLPATVLAVPEAAAPTALERHTAECVAALDVGTEDLARQVKAGRDELRPQLQDWLQHGTAFIGTAYLSGQRDERRSRSLLDEAREAQKSLPESQLRARQSACSDEGAALLTQSNPFSRALVSRLAANRLKKLLGE